MKKVIDINGMSKQKVKDLVKYEGYHTNSFYKIWKTKTMRVTVN